MSTHATAKLSSLQKALLRRILERHQAGQADPCWGIPFDLCFPGATTDPAGRCFSASLSRALRRLEERGLVQRRNQVSGDKHERSDRPGWIPPKANHRTTNIVLTAEGEAVALGLKTNG